MCTQPPWEFCPLMLLGEQNLNSGNMEKNLLIILILAIFTSACDSVDIDPDYPTTIHRISSVTLEQLRTEFAQTHVYLKSSLNGFGFCERHTGFEVNAQLPPVLDSLTEAEAREIIHTFVSNNPSATGVKHPEAFQLKWLRQTPAYPDGTIQWTARSANQVFDTLEVLDSKMYFSIKNRELVSAGNNWFPEIYVPAEFRVDLGEARSLLVGKVVSHYTIAGVEWKVTIAPEDVQASTSALKVLPIRDEDRIELRVVWELYIPYPVHYLMYVDVMTGAVVKQTPTIVS